MILNIGFLISFVAAMLLGYWKKKFVFLLGGVVLGLGVGVLSTYLYFAITPPEDVGFAIIALLPVAFIIFPAVNAVVALIGGLIGAIVGKRKLR